MRGKRHNKVRPGTYVLVKSGPDVNPDEVELGHVDALEVMILWETTMLHVQHLTPPRSFYVGEEEGKNFECDYFIPSEKLGTTRAPIVLASGRIDRFVILPGARGTIEIPGQPKMTFETAFEGGARSRARSSRARTRCRSRRAARRAWRSTASSSRSPRSARASRWRTASSRAKTRARSVTSASRCSRTSGSSRRWRSSSRRWVSRTKKG